MLIVSVDIPVNRVDGFHLCMRYPIVIDVYFVREKCPHGFVRASHRLMLTKFRNGVVEESNVVFASSIVAKFVAEVEAENVMSGSVDCPLVPGGVLGVARSSSKDVISNQDRRPTVGNAFYL